MLFAGGAHQFHSFMEGVALFRRVDSPCRTTTESYFTSVVLLQTVDKYSVDYVTSSIFRVYTEGEFFFSFSGLTCGLLVVTVSFFRKSSFQG